jgi:hypothetical protein
MPIPERDCAEAHDVIHVHAPGVVLDLAAARADHAQRQSALVRKLPENRVGPLAAG